MLSELLTSKLLYSITLTLLHFLWQGGVIALSLKIVLTITPLAKSQIRYASASFAMLLNLIIPLTTFYFIFTSNTPLNIKLLNNIVPLSQNKLPLMNAYWNDSLSLFSPYIAISWMTVCVFLTVKLCLELYQIRHLSRSGIIAPENQLIERFETLVKQLRLKCSPQLFISLKTEVPMAIGFMKPIVLIPVSMISGLTPAQLEMLILHELAHIRRHDYLINIFQTLIDTLLFFHPCCYWVSKQIRKEREYCCDDIAVTHCQDPIAYAHTLTDTASACHHHRHNIPKMAMAASGGDLKQRVLRLVNKEPSCTSSLYFPKGFAVLGLLLMGIYIGSHLKISVPLTQETKNNTSINTSEKNKVSINAFTSVNNQFSIQPIKIMSLSSNGLKNDIPDVDIITKTPIIFTNSSEFKTHKKLTSETTSEMVKPSIESLKKSVIAKQNHPIKRLIETSQSLLNSNLSINKVLSKNFISSEKKLTLAKDLPLLSSNHFKNEEEVKESLSMTKTKPEIHGAELIKTIEPRYPAIAQLKGVELDVKVNFTVNTEGKVEDIEFNSPSNSHYFKSSIRSAMKKWRFSPAQQNGKPIESTMTKIFSFNLLT